MIGTVQASESDIYKALVGLTQSIGGHGDLESLTRNLARSLRQVVSFEYLGLVLPDCRTGRLHMHTLTELPASEMSQISWEPDESNAHGWVWTNQKSVVVSVADTDPTWPELTQSIRSKNISTLVFVPLSNGEHQGFDLFLKCNDSFSGCFKFALFLFNFFPRKHGVGITQARCSLGGTYF